MRPYYLILLLSLFLVACGGGSGKTTLTNDQPATTEEPTKEGPNKEEPTANEQPSATYSISNKTNNSLSNIQAIAQAEKDLTIAPVYDVTSYKFEYASYNSKNKEVKVSGLVAIPKTDKAIPILSFQHGTIVKNKSAPSFHLKPTIKHPEVLLASLGYVVFSPDYIGYGSSYGVDHPYLQKQPSADTVIDMLKAGKQLLKKQNIATTRQLFMTGYSQGGYVTMAAMEAIQNAAEDDLKVTAAVLGAGPYDLYTTISTLYPDAAKLPSSLDNLAISIIEKAMAKKGADVKFDSTFIQRFLDDDRQDDAHKWKPNIPLKLLHGKDDKIVPIEASISAKNYMISQGADIELVDCSADPADHSACALPYLNYMINYFAGLPQN